MTNEDKSFLQSIGYFAIAFLIVHLVNNIFNWM